MNAMIHEILLLIISSSLTTSSGWHIHIFTGKNWF
jgi:hypothetical protein